MLRFALACLLVFSPALLRADEPPSAPPPDAKAEETAVQAWGAQHPECVEWSDGCVVCTPAGCSTTGIACTPSETLCRRP